MPMPRMIRPNSIGFLRGHPDLVPLDQRLARHAEDGHEAENCHEEPVEQRATRRATVTKLPTFSSPRAGRRFARDRQRAVNAAVEPVDQHADVQPAEEAHPGGDRQAQHQIKARDDAENRDQRSARDLERPVRVRALHAQHHHRRADNHEREQRADAGHSPRI